MKIVTIVGARPQFIKAAAISRAIREYNHSSSRKITEIIVHTGQHFDSNMSDIFFEELDIPKPDYNLEIANLSHGAMTGRMLEAIEQVLIDEKPDLVLIYGDTNSTLAGALAASKLHIKIAHVEAGLRSFNMRMPEEINRIVSDRISNLLFCPTQEAVTNLSKEGIQGGVHQVGDVMYDVTLYYRDKVRNTIELDLWGVTEKKYALCTIHRAENTDDLSRLLSILESLREISNNLTVLLPLHPRTKKLIAGLDEKDVLQGLKVLEPIPYLQMLRLEMSAKVILTDSGGVQKEAFFHKVPCITLRDETEWVETVKLGWNQLAGSNKTKILDAFTSISERKRIENITPYGDGNASEDIVALIAN